YIIKREGMNKVTTILLCVLFSSCSLLFGDFYDDYARIFGDQNAGLTIFPTLLIPLGGRMEGMGTAFTAMAIDSGFIESNPSGSSMLAYNELSFYHHSWIADSNLEGIVYTSRFGDLGLAACGKFLYLPFEAYGEWGRMESSGMISETIGMLNISYNFLSSYYFSGLAVGMNLKGAFRNIPENIYPDQSIVAGMVDIGALTRFNFLKFYSSRDKNFSVGVAVKNVGIQSVDDLLPMMVSSGIAYSFIKPVTIAVDFNLPFSFDQENHPAALWDVAIGANIIFTDFISMQTGFRFKENPRISLGCSVDMNNFTIVTNYNYDLTASLNPIDKFSVEVKVKLGEQESIKKQKEVDTLFAQGLDAYARGDYWAAIELWEKALELDPKFLLARDYIETTKKYLELQKEMEEKQENIQTEN
ncbi:MAG: UPF0164 family protein, partial [Spirochaetales bacterium]|nr:UPF0164 family protein [Spirochaetales bacterium]